MHDGPWIYIQEKVARYGPFGRVVEFGGRNVNGSVRQLFTWHETTYLSIDIMPGDGVDLVLDAAEFQATDPYDVVVCCEVFEHTQRWPDLIASAWRALGDDGYLFATCATDPRRPHSAHDGGGLSESEWYENVSAHRLAEELSGFGAVEVRVDRRHGDLYVVAVKGNGDL